MNTIIVPRHLRPERKAYMKAYFTPERRKRYSDKWKANNPEKLRASKRKWYLKNREKVIRRSCDRILRLQKEDPLFRITQQLRHRINMAIKNGWKSAKTKQLLGCSIEDFMIYLESRFEVGMTWQNYGKTWHVDHIVPCALFDLSRSEHQRRCFHFSNLRPMFAKKKSVKTEMV